MDKDRGRSSLNKLRRAFLKNGLRPRDLAMTRAVAIFRLLIVASAGLIVSAGWYFVDRSESYRVWYPSPRTYLAQSSVRFVDDAATKDLRDQASDQIAQVRVRDNQKTRAMERRLADLKANGNLGFAPSDLVKLIESYPEAQKKRILATVIAVAEQNFGNFVDRKEQTAALWSSLGKISMSQAEKNIAFQILDVMLEPTLSDDYEMAYRLREDVSQQIPPVVREIRLGGVLVEKGRIVTPGLAEILRNQGYPDAAMPWKQLTFILIVSFFWSLWLVWLAAKLDVRLTDREWMYVALLMVVNWGSQKAFAAWGVDSISLLATTGWLFLTLPPAFAFHVALGGGLIGYLLAFPGMTSTIAVGCVVSGVASGSGYIFFREAASRIMIWRNIFGLGLILTITSLFIRWGFGLALSLRMFALYISFCAIWSSLVVALLPLLESTFDIISPLRLLEMSHPSQPLLKRLQMEAPGTYHHTITVSTLAEAVADRLGMNGLLVKTGVYYHDIGKLKRPHYFVENQPFGDNIHDRLAPRESAKIILSHVTDGLELADEYKLPSQIKRFISEHHGKTCLTYFYKKAQAADKEAGGDGEVNQADFCYPGPAPQSQETALTMLADSIEAAMKGLNRTLAGRAELEKIVSDVVDSKVISGQFSAVDFTLKDIAAIKNAFVDVLVSMYHSREIKPLRPENDAPRETNAPAA